MKIIQLIPAQPGWYATYRDHWPDRPIACWALVERTEEEVDKDWNGPGGRCFDQMSQLENGNYQAVVGLSMRFLQLEDAEDPDLFMGYTCRYADEGAEYTDYSDEEPAALAPH